MDTYEKKYKEALELARDYYKANLKLYKADENVVLEDIFPELKESEDERIRKALLELVHDTTGDELWVDYNVHKEDALAWLEKQGGQKTAWSEDDELVVEDIEEAVINYWHGQSQEDLLDWLKSLKDRCTWKPSKEQMKALHDLNLTGNLSYAGQGQVLIELYNDLKKLKG